VSKNSKQAMTLAAFHTWQLLLTMMTYKNNYNYSHVHCVQKIWLLLHTRQKMARF